jgi:ParB-like chromosome segregation protein Spo0J
MPSSGKKIPRAVSQVPPSAVPSSPSAPPAGLIIRYRLLASIAPYARNSRTHTAKQIGKIEASLARYGWTTPLLIASDSLIAGHARHIAATNLAQRGIAIPRNVDPRMAPTIDLSALSPAERRAYVIADNKLASDAGWDNEMLRLELSDLKGDGFDLSLTGFSGPEIGVLLGVAGAAEGPALAPGMRYQVVVECLDEAHQALLLGDLAARGLKVRPLIV